MGFCKGLRLLLSLLGGSWVVISGVISPLTWVTTIATLLITPLITTHEPPSRSSFRHRARGVFKMLRFSIGD